MKPIFEATFEEIGCAEYRAEKLVRLTSAALFCFDLQGCSTETQREIQLPPDHQAPAVLSQHFSCSCITASHLKETSAARLGCPGFHHRDQPIARRGSKLFVVMRLSRHNGHGTRSHPNRHRPRHKPAGESHQCAVTSSPSGCPSMA